MIYKTISTLFIYVTVAVTAFAQPSKEQRIEDSVIGWWSKLSIPAPKIYEGDGKAFSLQQQQNMNNVITWMQQSYTPVGGIGTYTRRWYKDKNSFKPFQYGVDFRVWNVSYMKEYLDEKGHFKPVSEEYTRFDFSANTIPGSYAIAFINTPTQYLFTWPPNGYGQIETDNFQFKQPDPRIHPNVYPYITRINEIQTVFLAPENELPFIAVTKGEYLQLAEVALGRVLQKQQEEVNQQWSDTKTREEVFQYKKEQINRYINAIQQVREKHKNTLNEPAVLRYMQPAYNNIDGSMDPFEISPMEKKLKAYFPVYKIDPAVLPKCNSNQPQWLSLSFPYRTKEEGNQLYEMYTAVTENFNYEYVYDYFYNPNKVKGKVYQPVNEDQLKARLAAYRNKYFHENTPSVAPSNLSPNTIFADNFSKNSDGAKVAGWYYRTYGKHASVTSLPDFEGKWLRLGYGNAVNPTTLKLPLPESFSIAFDVVTDDFTSRTGGAVELNLSTVPPVRDGVVETVKSSATLSLKITAGNENDFNNNNYMGTAKLEMHSTPSVNNDNYNEGVFITYDMREFTNKQNRVNVQLKIKAGVISLLLNGKSVATSNNFKLTYGKPCISCNFPATASIKNLYWTNVTNDADHVSVYISNVKITKE
ncbi:MAG: hypothetical protein ACOYKE_08425 [Ferruginibacter sp.]